MIPTRDGDTPKQTEGQVNLMRWLRGVASPTGVVRGAFVRQRGKARSKLSGLLGAAILSLGAAPWPAGPAQAQGVVKNTFGDWQLRCETPAGAQNEQCAIVQNVTAEDRPNVSLVVIVLKTADQKSRLLRVVAPLGVLLPAGLGLKIDQADIGRAGFVRCLTTGCVAEVVMEDPLVNQLKDGKTATFIVFQTPEEGIGIPVSLNGFGQAFDALP
jgi:invasion protein IalB